MLSMLLYALEGVSRRFDVWADEGKATYAVFKLGAVLVSLQDPLRAPTRGTSSR